MKVQLRAQARKRTIWSSIVRKVDSVTLVTIKGSNNTAY